MDQHPVPQDITGFQFKLVGDMTLKQFGYLAIGSVIGFVLYSSSWATFVKIPLALSSFLIGICFAFVPVEERPLETWVTNFFKSIYRPTQYVWKKNIDQLGTLSAIKIATVSEEPIIQPPSPPPPPSNTQKLDDYLQTLPSSPTGPSIDDLMSQRENEIKKIQNEIKDQEPQRVLTIDKLQSLHNQQSQSPTPENAQAIANYQSQLDKQNSLIQDLTSKLADLEKQTKTQDRLTSKLSEQKQALMGEVAVLKKQAADAAKTPPPPPPDKPSSRTSLSPNRDYPSNTISGQVKDPSGKTLDNVIVIFKNAQGTPVRALRTNKLGQFLASTPLEDGSYSIELEKEGFTFPTTNLTLSGSPIPPFDITAK